MKIEIRTKTQKNLIIVSIIAFTAIFISSFNKETSSTSPEDIPEQELMPAALNQMLSNELSALPQTTTLDQQIDRFLKRWEIKGASIAIMKDEKLIYAKGYGWADQENNERTDVRHIFRLASVSKLITAVAIMKLREEGRLSLEDKIFGEGAILDSPEFSRYRDKRVTRITVEHLLRHKGGFSNRAGDPLFSLAIIKDRLKLDRAVTEDELIQYVLSRRLGYTPGTSTIYSNFGYLLLSKVIEKVSGESYEQYVKERLLKPNGIYDMYLAHNYYSEKYDNEVRYYEPSNQQPIRSYNGSDSLMPRCYGGNNIRLLSGAGAWVASPVELLKLISMIDGRDNVPDIISKESVRLMTSSGPSILPMGWAKCTSSGDWSRTGTLSGSSAMVKYNRHGYSWVFITNTSSWRGSRFPRSIDYFFKGALQKVTDWPHRDLFNVTVPESARS
jgi:CubicO group peptidase (beta-lactamase class C family)